MVRVSRLLPVGALALFATGVLGAGLGAACLPTAARAQEAAGEAPAADAPATTRRGRRHGRERTKRPEKSTTASPAMQQATPVAIFGDWNVFVNGDGRTKLCYAVAQPQTRAPKTLKRDTAYLFVSVRKSENIQNEVAVMLGFPSRPPASQLKPGAAATPTDPTLNLGTGRYGLVVKDGNAWLQNPSEETRVVTEMSGRNPKLTIKTTSMRGNPTSDEYALAGFADAMKRTREECNR